MDVSVRSWHASVGRAAANSQWEKPVDFQDILSTNPGLFNPRDELNEGRQDQLE